MPMPVSAVDNQSHTSSSLDGQRFIPLQLNLALDSTHQFFRMPIR